MKHSLLSPSSAERWLHCTPAPRLEEGVPNKSSSYADEGTLAHDYAEKRLSASLGLDKPSVLANFKKNVEIPPDMEESIALYVAVIQEKISEAARTGSYVVRLEQKYDVSEYIPDCKGTSDCTIISGDTLEIVDLKFGKGIKVFAAGNPQMRIYALGALKYFDMVYDIKTVKMTIAQVRLGHIDTEELTVEELLHWAETELKPKAQMAYKGEGEFKSGDHCRFCRVKNTCRKRAEENLALAKMEFKAPALLSDEELIMILDKADELAQWAKGIKEHVEIQAITEGKVFKGWKVIQGKSKRIFTDLESVKNTLLLEGINPYQDPELKTITELEKILGKKQFNKILGDYIDKPPGKPKLVRENEEGDERSSAADDFQKL